MVASKLQIHIFQLPDKISTKFQRLNLRFRGPAFHWDSWEYYATKLKVKKPRWRFLSFKCMLGLHNDLYLATLSPPGKSKWRPQSRDRVFFPCWHISASIADSNIIVTATSIIEVQQLNGSIVHYIRHKGSPELQNGGLQTGNTYISACWWDKNAIILTQ